MSASSRLLRALHQRGDMTRAAATKATGLARSAVGTAVEDLSRLGFILVHKPVAGGLDTGRPSPVLELLPATVAIVAVRLEPTRVILAVVDLLRRVTKIESQEINFPATSPETSLKQVASLIDNFIESSDITKLCGLSISVPGVVDENEGRAERVLAFGWKDVPVVSLLRRFSRATAPIFLGHDATFGALAEFRTRNNRVPERLLFVTSEAAGVGAAMVVSTQDIIRSEVSGQTLQAGHLIVEPDGPLCACGSRGCLEVFLSGGALMRACGGDDSAAYSNILETLEGLSVNELTNQQLRMITKPMQTALVSLVNTLGPDRVVFSGLLAPIYLLIEQDLNAALNLSVVAQIRGVDMSSSNMRDATVLGGAEVAFGPLLAEPSLIKRLGAFGHLSLGLNLA